MYTIQIRYRSKTTKNLSDIDFSRSLNVKFNSAIGLLIYGFLLMFNSNIGPSWVHILNIRLRKLSDLEFDLSRSLKVKFNSAIGLPIHGFLLMVNSDISPNSAPLRDIKSFEI